MNFSFDQLMDKITDFLRNETRTENILGEQFTLGDFICQPVLRFGLDLGSGNHKDQLFKSTEGDNNHLGMVIEPVGFLVTKGNQISYLAINQTQSTGLTSERLSELFQNNFLQNEHVKV